jgi:type 1 glutamine amidotransferase
MSDNKWYSNARRKVLIDNHLDDWLPGYEQYDSKKIADTIINSDFEAGMIYARCHVGTCYWNASEGPKHKGLGDHDQIGEISAYLQEAGVHFILYYSTVFDKKLWDAHPDWRIIGGGEEGGMFGKKSRYKQVCPNSPYRAYTVRALEEIAKNYPIEGAFLDMTFWPAVCYCEHCKKAWGEASGGKAIPDKDWEDSDWKRFIHWRYASMTSFIRDCVAALHKYRPGIVVSYQCPNQIHNGWIMGDDINAADSGGIPSHDVYYPSGHIHLSLQPRLFQATSPVHPFDVFISRPVVGLRDMPSMKPYIHMLAETCSVLANGGAVIYIDQIHPDGSLYKDHWEQFKRLNAEITRRQEFTGGEPLPYAGMYFSQDTRDFFGQDNFEERYMAEFVGACKALLEEHILFDIVTPRNLSSLSKYKVIVLPNTACLSKREVEAFRKFVENGGGLVGTYEVSSGNEWNDPYPQPALGDVFCLHRLGDTSDFTDTYFQVVEGKHPVAEGLYRQRPITCMLKQTLVEATGEAESLANVVFPYTEWTPNRYVSIHNNPPGVMTGRPAILANKYGRGRAVYFSAQVGAMYAMDSYWEARKLIANAVRWAAAAPAPVEVDAPVCIELTTWDQDDKNRRVIHLVNVQSDITRTVSLKGDFGVSHRENLHVIQDILPVYDLPLRFQVPAGKQVKRVMMQPENVPLVTQEKDGWVEVKVPKVHVHEAIVIEWN